MAQMPKKSNRCFQQDLAPWHKSNIVKEKIADLKLDILDWAPKSPALNRMEMLWSILDKKLS